MLPLAVAPMFGYGTVLRPFLHGFCEAGMGGSRGMAFLRAGAVTAGRHVGCGGYWRILALSTRGDAIEQDAHKEAVAVSFFTQVMQVRVMW
jgi:hypothetical protein